MARQRFRLLTACPVNNNRIHPVHTAHRRRQLKRAQDIAHRIAVQPVVTVSALWLTGRDDDTPVLPRTLIAPYPAGETPTQHAVETHLEQRRTAIGIERMLEHNDVMLTQQLLLVRNINKE